MGRDIVVVHPGVQHSGDLALSLEQAGRLSRLVTRLQVGEDPPSFYRSGFVLRRIPRRIVEELPDDRIRRRGPWHEVLLRTTSRLGLRTFSRRLDGRLAQSFVDDAVEAIGPEVRAVIATDTAALQLFRKLSENRPDVARILDISHPLDAAVQPMIREDAQRNGLRLEDYDDFHEGTPHDQRAELGSADLILVASSFSESTLAFAGPETYVVRRVPYPADASPLTSRPRRTGNTLRVLALGAMSERKGMTLLLNAMESALRASSPVELTIAGRAAGAYALPATLPSNTRYVEAPDRLAVERLYQSSDVLVLPSMCEGFGRTLLEALSFGLSVITTERSGGPDIVAASPSAPVTIIPVAERSQLADVLHAHAVQPEKFLRPEAAVAACEQFTSSTYRRRLTDAVDDAIAMASKRHLA